uniref:Uncharacterized protein n=1 Tax=Daphnia galeata TaxID=27404 RepID=A0A8J2W5Q5_9CRUS|nr:unnamed protein product [Daphnia galeata]
MNNPQKSKKVSSKSKNPATKMASRVAIVVSAILIYVILCSITGSTIYAIYGWKGPGSGPDGNIITAFQGMAEVATQQIFPVVTPTTTNVIPIQQPIIPVVTTTPNVIPIQQPIIPVVTTTTTNVIPIQQPIIPCPPVVQIPCPQYPICQLNNGMECQPKLPPPPCYHLPAPVCPTCPSPPPCICPSTPCPALPVSRPIDEFTRGQRMSKTVSQWLNFYPPYSKNRLIVATTLLDDMIEPWALVGSFHRCMADSNNDILTTTCNICQDRYEYIKCVISSPLIEDNTPATMAKSNGWFNSDTEFTSMRGWLPEFVYHGWSRNMFDGIMARYQKEIDAMTVRTTSGKICRVCTDFNRNVFDKCFSR